MRKQNYMKQAAHQFLEGTRFRTPVDAVEAGGRSILEWCECLRIAREAHLNAMVLEPVLVSPRRTRKMRVVT